MELIQRPGDAPDVYRRPEDDVAVVVVPIPDWAAGNGRDAWTEVARMSVSRSGRVSLG